MIDPRKSFGIFGSRTEMAADMKKLLCNFYMHEGECNQSNRKRSHPQVGADQLVRQRAYRAVEAMARAIGRGPSEHEQNAG